MEKRKASFKRRKYINIKKVKNGLKGSISIFLCLLLTPFLTIVLGLSEYARAQEAKALANEALELTAISELSDYDQYILDRFGFLCTSQENTLGDSLNTNLSANMSSLGNQMTWNNATVAGKLPLSNTAALRQQLVTFSEVTVPLSLLYDNVLNELIDKLNSVTEVAAIADTMNNVGTFADSLSTVVEKLETLKDSVSSSKTSAENSIALATELSNKVSTLYQKLNTVGILLPADATADEITAAVETFCSTYVDDIKTIYQIANNLKNSIVTLNNSLTTIKNNADAFVDAVEEAKTAANNITAGNSIDEDGSITNAASNTMDGILSQMSNLVDDTIENLKTTLITNAQIAINGVIDTVMQETGLADITTRYQLIIDGEYFKDAEGNITDMAKQDITGLLRVAYSVYAGHSEENIADYFIGLFVPSFNAINYDSIISSIQDILDRANTDFQEEAETSLVTLFTNLVNAVKSIFDLEVFYDTDLCAFVNTGNTSSSPYQRFLEAIGLMFTAIEEFTDSIGGWNLLKALKAVGKMFKSMGEMMSSLVSIVGDTVTNIMKLAGTAVSGDVQALYEELLIGGYMLGSLPCRTDDAGRETVTISGATCSRVKLSGETLTGSSYNSIARPGKNLSSLASGGLQNLHTFINNVQAGAGTDTMFCGAELEYIRAGTNSEIANQVICFLDIYFIRLVCDMVAVFSDPEVATVAAAANIASWVVYILYILVEPLCDTIVLVNGETVPIIKTDCFLTVTGLPGFISKIGSVMSDDIKQALEDSISTVDSTSSGASGETEKDSSLVGDLLEIDYKTHMLLVLVIGVDANDMVTRLGDLVKLETAEYYRQNGGTFDINKTYTAVEVSADVTLNMLFDLGTYNGGPVFAPTTRVKQLVGY